MTHHVQQQQQLIRKQRTGGSETTFKVLKEKGCQPRIPSKYVKIKTFQDKQKQNASKAKLPYTKYYRE